MSPLHAAASAPPPVPHRRRASLALARATAPLPYPEQPAPPATSAPAPASPTPLDASATAVPVPRPLRPRLEPLPPMPPNAAVPTIRTSVADLLALARHGLAEAGTARTPSERYAAAHLGALRAAAAVIATYATPSPAPARRARPISAWVLLASIAPELREWAAFFSAGAAKRAAAESAIPGAVTAREADDLLRDAETFIAVVETKLAGAARPSLLDRGVG